MSVTAERLPDWLVYPEAEGRTLTPAQGALLTCDEDCPESIEAGVEALFGETAPTGRLPVRVSERYPFGWGRTTGGA